MKNRIEKKFEELKAKKQKALVTFITAGDSNLKTTERLVPALAEAGADIIELGMPFSDPMADGPVIQRSSERALRAKTTLTKIFASVRTIRKTSQVPILLMGYYNPVFQFGISRFFAKAKRSGVDGALLVDLPPEEAGEAKREAKKQGLALIFLLAPTSDTKRIKQVVRQASGFIYYVSMTGITGSNLSNTLTSQKALKTLKKSSAVPVCVGFGIKNAKQAKTVASYADGVVVGSALIQILEENKGPQAIAAAKRFIAKLSNAVH